MNKNIILSLVLALAWLTPVRAQWETHESVLNTHTWFKIGITEEGIYGIDHATLQALGVDTRQLDPSRIQMYSNPIGTLPEANSAERIDDLTEIALEVVGGGDGTFDEGDRILFYGTGPVKRIWRDLGFYDYERNLFSDTVYYFLCIDSDTPGLRILDKPVVPTSANDSVISAFNELLYHESEELSPYASGRTWYGDMFTARDGYKEFVFDVPHFESTKPVRIGSVVMGRSSERFTYNLKVNDVSVVDHQMLDIFKDYIYGREHSANKMLFASGDRLTVRYEIDPSAANPLLFIDYLTLSCWRSLVLDGDELAFGITPFIIYTPTTRVRLGGVDQNAVCWDVTDPLAPLHQPLVQQADGYCFGITTNMEQRYYLFREGAIKPVPSVRRIPNQNLHGIENAEMLIITPKVFRAPSEALAGFHREHDGLDCVLADVEEVFNEFGTGIGDPTAVRDFIRMVYLRSEGNLKYVLLMGKGSHDYRDIKGLHMNFVPTYETAASTCDEVMSQCTDDYFALMDENEGNKCDGKVDLGVGRLPITTEEQGFALVEKIKRYADLSTMHGIWKNNHLFFADNDKSTYLDYTEGLETILDTAWPGALVQKLYIDTYPIVSTPVGDRVPQAHEHLMEAFNKGFSVMSYTGHGGTKSLTSEWVLALSDINALSNEGCLPFVHTATCEFSKFDNPGVVSGGELLLLNSHGGAIALLTTLRPTLGSNNQLISAAFHKYVYRKRDGETLRFGDIYRLAKSDPKYYTKSNLGFILFGDPALRFSYPTHEVKTLSVNGMDAGNESIFQVSDMLTVTGVITDPQGAVDTLFNGVLDLRLFDRKTKFSTLGTYTDAIDYSFYHDVLFEGKVSVTHGEFMAQIPIPSGLSYANGFARLDYYAYDSVRKVDANGFQNHLNLMEATEVDLEGPEIEFYWNSPDFQSGDVVVRRGALYANLFDESGIYHYNVSIGRNITLRSNLEGYDNLVLDAYYEPTLDDYRRGRIMLPLPDLADGTYEFTLKAWDLHDNASEKTITLVVEESLLLAQVHTQPNPFDEETYFVFSHGDMSEELDVRIEIFDLYGRRVADLQRRTASEVGVVPAIRWDGRSDSGARLPAGIYVFKMGVTDSEGRYCAVTKRLVKK